MSMSKRLQVLLDEGEYREIQAMARRRHVTVSEWVRQALQAARRREPVRDTERKLQAVRAASTHALPTGDIEAMLNDIERGYLGGAR